MVISDYFVKEGADSRGAGQLSVLPPPLPPPPFLIMEPKLALDDDGSIYSIQFIQNCRRNRDGCCGQQGLLPTAPLFRRRIVKLLNTVLNNGTTSATFDVTSTSHRAAVCTAFITFLWALRTRGNFSNSTILHFPNVATGYRNILYSFHSNTFYRRLRWVFAISSVTKITLS